MPDTLNTGTSTGHVMVSFTTDACASEQEAHPIVELKRTMIFGNILPR